MLQEFKRKWKHQRRKTIFLIGMGVFFLTMLVWRPGFAQPAGTTGGQASPVTAAEEHSFRPFGLFKDPNYTTFEKGALIVVLITAFAGLAYAGMLVGQVTRADSGTPRMQEIARAVREGANAYLAAQFRKIGPLILIITVLLYFTYTGEHRAFGFGRAAAFVIGSIFSWLVGFVGMRLATVGNLRVAAAAQRSYGEAMQLCYRTGTITGMLTDVLELLGGTVIFLT